MTLVRFSLYLLVLSSAALGGPEELGPFADCALQVALRGARIKISVVPERQSDPTRKIELIQEANDGKIYLGLATIPFGVDIKTNFLLQEGVLSVQARSAGPVFGVEDPDLRQMQDMALIVMHWDIYIARADVFGWNEAKLESVLKFVVETQRHPERWKLVQKGKHYSSAHAITRLRRLDTLLGMQRLMLQNCVPDFYEFADMVRRWGNVATMEFRKNHPEWHDTEVLAVVMSFFGEARRSYDAKVVLDGLTRLREASIAENVARFVVSKIDESRPFYVVVGARSAESLTNVFTENLPGNGIQIHLER